MTMPVQFKMALVKSTAANFHDFISRTNAKMEELITEANGGEIPLKGPMDSLAVQLIKEFADKGHAQALRDIGKTAEELAARARVEYLSEYDARMLAGELADMLEQYQAERDRIVVFYDKMHAMAKMQTELN